MVEQWESESIGEPPLLPKPDATRKLVSSQVFPEPPTINSDGQTVWKVSGRFVYED